jgi:hypothetical protein
MTVVQSMQSPAVLVAIDIAKLRHEGLIEAPDWKSRKRLVLLNTTIEFHRVASYLHGLKHPVRVALEATGNYHRPLASSSRQKASTWFLSHLWLWPAPAKQCIIPGTRMTRRTLRFCSICSRLALDSIIMIR